MVILVLIYLLDGIPSDGSAINVTHSIEIGLTSVMYILAPVGIAGAIACFAFIVIFRHKRQEEQPGSSVALCVNVSI